MLMERTMDLVDYEYRQGKLMFDVKKHIFSWEIFGLEHEEEVAQYVRGDKAKDMVACKV